MPLLDRMLPIYVDAKGNPMHLDRSRLGDVVTIDDLFKGFEDETVRIVISIVDEDVRIVRKTRI